MLLYTQLLCNLLAHTNWILLFRVLFPELYFFPSRVSWGRLGEWRGLGSRGTRNQPLQPTRGKCFPGVKSRTREWVTKVSLSHSEKSSPKTLCWVFKNKNKLFGKQRKGRTIPGRGRGTKTRRGEPAWSNCGEQRANMAWVCMACLRGCGGEELTTWTGEPGPWQTSTPELWRSQGGRLTCQGRTRCAF